MKRTFINFIVSIIFVSILGVLLIFGISALKNTNIISLSFNDNLVLILSLILCFLFGFIFGYKEKKRGFFIGLVLMIFYLIIIYSIKAIKKETITSGNHLIIISRSILLFSGAYIGTHIRNKN